MKEIKISGVSISPERRYVFPTDEEIGFMSKVQRQYIDGVPLAVRIRRIKEAELPLLNENNIKVEQQWYQNICRSYPHFAFLSLFQFKKGVRLLPGHFKVMELVQNIPEAQTITCYPHPRAVDFKNSMDEFESRYGGKKEILPLLDPAHTETELQKMVQEVINQKYKTCAILGRDFDLDGWDVVLPELVKNGIVPLVLGIYPRATWIDKGVAYSMLCPPILMGAVAVSHGMAWSGGPSPPKRLGKDFVYRVTGRGPASKYDYHDSRAEAVNIANTTLKNEIKNKVNSQLLTVEGFSHFSEFA